MHGEAHFLEWAEPKRRRACAQVRPIKLALTAFLKRALMRIPYALFSLFARKATPVLSVNLAPAFRAGAVRSLRNIAPAAESLRLKVFKGASTAAIGAVAGWGGVVVLGAMLLLGASHHRAPTAPASDPAVAAVVAPTPPVAAAPVAPPAAPKEVAAAPAPAPAPTKVTQRVDMTPTAAIPDTPKPHKRLHKKKPLDNAN
jgi:hypothetical protein